MTDALYAIIVVLSVVNVVLIITGYRARKRYEARITVLELEIIELKTKPCVSECARLLQTEQFARDAIDVAKGLSARVHVLEVALARVLDAGLPGWDAASQQKLPVVK